MSALTAVLGKMAESQASMMKTQALSIQIVDKEHEMQERRTSNAENTNRDLQNKVKETVMPLAN